MENFNKEKGKNTPSTSELEKLIGEDLLNAMPDLINDKEKMTTSIIAFLLNQNESEKAKQTLVQNISNDKWSNTMLEKSTGADQPFEATSSQALSSKVLTIEEMEKAIDTIMSDGNRLRSQYKLPKPNPKKELLTPTDPDNKNFLTKLISKHGRIIANNAFPPAMIQEVNARGTSLTSEERESIENKAAFLARLR